LLEKSIKIELYEKLIACLALPMFCYMVLFPIYIIALIGKTPMRNIPMGIHVTFLIACTLLIINLIVFALLRKNQSARIDFYQDCLIMFIEDKEINLAYKDIRAVIYYKYPLWTLPLVLLANGAHAAGALTFQTKENRKYSCHVFLRDYKTMLHYLKRNRDVRIIED
jgi:hypothetical protein